MPDSYSTEQLPFTPPPYYVPKKDLPRGRGKNEALAELNSSRSSFQVLRRVSIRGSSNQNQDRVGKLTMKRQKPGLSINTNVNASGKSPREITVRQAPVKTVAVPPSFDAPPNIGQALPLQYSQPVQSHFSAATNSPSRFPSAYLSTSGSITQQNQPPRSQDLFFAAPPRPASSLYSRSARNSFINRDSLRKFASKNAQARESNMTAFEEDFEIPQRQRALSTDTIFEEDTAKPQPATGTLTTATPHRSRGWWNVVTTPFAKTPTDGSQGIVLENARRQDGELQYPPVPVPPVPGLCMNHSHSQSSTGSATFTPSDQDIPIALSGDLMAAMSLEHGDKDDKVDSSNASAESLIETSSETSQMPFADVVKSPASRNEEMSPAGLVCREGVVACSTARVQMAATEARPHIRDSIMPEHGLTSASPRSPIRAAVSRTVRFVTPRSSVYPPPPGQYTASKEPFHPPPTPYYRRDSFNSFQEYDSDEADRKKPQKKKKSRSCGSCWTFGKSKKTKKEKADEKKMTRRRKCCFCCLCLVITFLVLLALVIVLAVMLGRRKASKSPDQPTWVNTTKFPPMVTGAMTVARPNLASSQSSCVNPSTAWSCAVPKEQQDALLPNDPSQPNFLINVRFDNSSDLAKRASLSSTAYAGHLLKARAFTPSPAIPALDEQSFLGNTTDKNVAPFEGESTPFYISFNDPASSVGSSNTPTKVKRQSKPSASVNTVPELVTNIPLPSLNPDNTPGPANLLPLPQEQPLRLYNRGRDDEHYGFYTYYDKNIFLRSITTRNSTLDVVSSDLNGGASQAGANFRCNWTNTRFRVQIWTKRSRNALLSKATTGSKLAGGDFKRPGTFPYPITITLDRHGGGLSTKFLYCFAMDDKGKILKDQRTFLAEDRTFNGTLVNASPGPFTSMIPKVSTAEGGPGGIDGGTGGCGCSWQNWS